MKTNLQIRTLCPYERLGRKPHRLLPREFTSLPMPQRWNALWKLLPDRKRVGGGWEPALPLILAAWHDTPYLMKMRRLVEHIDWADKHGALESVAAFLRALREDEWFDRGE